MYNNGGGSICSPDIQETIFSGNSADFGGALFNYGQNGASNPTLINVVFSGNYAESNGGAIYNEGNNGDSSPRLIHTTVSGNKAGLLGGGMFNNGVSSGNSVPYLDSTIFWRNSDFLGNGTLGANVYNNSGITLVGFSILQGAGTSGMDWTGDSSYYNDGDNIDQDPMFVAPVNPSDAPTTAGNLKLKKDSPAIDRGDNTNADGIQNDLDGKPRQVDGNKDGTAVVDIGAYEYLPLYTLSVTKKGTGNGLVTSSPAGINCGGTCSFQFQFSSEITLTAHADNHSIFTHWGGDCSGSQICAVYIDSDKSVTAHFEKAVFQYLPSIFQ